MPHVPESIAPDKQPAEGSRDTVDESLDDTTSGGGRESGGKAPRPKRDDEPRPRPEDAASGRKAPDPLGAANQPDSLVPPRGDTSRK